MKKLALLTVALVALPSVVAADVIFFKSGTAKTGIVEEETPTTVKIRIEDKVVGISRASIERVEYATPEENERIELKWKEEKERIEEERRLKQAQREKLEMEQKAKGLVKIGDEYLSPAEMERREQQGIRAEIERQRAARTAEETPEPSEEPELPEFVQGLPEEQKQLYIESMKRLKNIEVGQTRVESDRPGQTVLAGTVTNRDEGFAGTIDLEVRCSDEAGEVISVESARVFSLKPGESGSFFVTARVDKEFIKRTDVRVVSAVWR
jgi:hypothetical protein